MILYTARHAHTRRRRRRLFVLNDTIYCQARTHTEEEEEVIRIE
jgi:hypothetical protein